MCAGSEEGSALAQTAAAWRHLRTIAAREANSAGPAASDGDSAAAASATAQHLQRAERAFEQARARAMFCPGSPRTHAGAVVS